MPKSESQRVKLFRELLEKHTPGELPVYIDAAMEVELNARPVNDVDWAVGIAAKSNHQDLVDRLLACGADFNCAVKGAARGNHAALLNALLARGASIYQAVEAAAEGNHAALVDALLARGADINCAVKGAELADNKALQIHLGATRGARQALRAYLAVYESPQLGRGCYGAISYALPFMYGSRNDCRPC